MTLTDDFEAARERVNQLPKSPDVSTQLKLYGLYKQGNLGDNTGKRPGMLDIRGRAKYDAWAENKGMSQDDAKQAYVALVDKLLAAPG